MQSITSLAEAFPDAQFVHVIRDGRDVAISMRKAGWLNGKILTIAEYWQKQVQAGISAGRSLENSKNRYYEVYYEQLLQQPEATLKDLCTWLHLEYTPQMLEYYRDANTNIQPEHSNLFKLNRKPIDASRAYAWKSQLSHRDIADFESIASNLLVALGYELDGVKISLKTKLIRSFKSSLTPFLYQLKRKLKT
ncbi:MAG: sulfotransferase family protein [Waterburya sp.]